MSKYADILSELRYIRMLLEPITPHQHKPAEPQPAAITEADRRYAEVKQLQAALQKRNAEILRLERENDALRDAHIEKLLRALGVQHG